MHNEFYLDSRIFSWDLFYWHLSARMAGLVGILSIMICARIAMIGWIITYLDIMDSEWVVGLAIAKKRSLAPHPSILDLVYSSN